MAEIFIFFMSGACIWAARAAPSAHPGGFILWLWDSQLTLCLVAATATLVARLSSLS